MARMVNSWNEWDPLKRVIVGRVYGASIPPPDPEWWHDCPEGGYPRGSWGPYPQDQIDAASEQQDYFVSVLEQRGIVVDQMEIHPSVFDRRAVSTPDWTQLAQYPAVPCRDVYLLMGNELIETPCSRRSRWFEYLNLRPVFERYFREDPDFEWISAPKPRLSEESFVKDYYYHFYHVWSEDEKQEHARDWAYLLTEKEPLWDGADAGRWGKDIFVQASVTTNRAGVDWLRRHFAPRGIRIHTVQFANDLDPWHIDPLLVGVRPGLAIYNPGKPPITQELLELFKRNDWELVPGGRPTHVYEAKCRVFTEYGRTSWISMNTLALGPNTICVEAHETAHMEALDKLGIEVVPIPYEQVVPFGGSLHCTTLDVYREGTLEDYFPDQVRGF